MSTRSPEALPALMHDGGLSIPAGGGLTFHTTLPANARVDVDARGGPVAIEVSDGRRSVEVAPGADLSAYAERPVRVTFRAKGAAVVMHEPRITLPGVPQAFRRPEGSPKHVLIWLVDTLRPDQLPVYNPKTRVEAPHFQRLADEGVTFESCMAQGNESMSSHASLFTGQYPVVHRLTTPKRRLKRYMNF